MRNRNLSRDPKYPWITSSFRICRQYQQKMRRLQIHLRTTTSISMIWWSDLRTWRRGSNVRWRARTIYETRYFQFYYRKMILYLVVPSANRESLRFKTMWYMLALLALSAITLVENRYKMLFCKAYLLRNYKFSTWHSFINYFCKYASLRNTKSGQRN